MDEPSNHRQKPLSLPVIWQCLFYHINNEPFQFEELEEAANGHNAELRKIHEYMVRIHLPPTVTTDGVLSRIINSGVSPNGLTGSLILLRTFVVPFAVSRYIGFLGSLAPSSSALVRCSELMRSKPQPVSTNHDEAISKMLGTDSAL